MECGARPERLDVSVNSVRVPDRDIVAFPEIEEAKKKYSQDYEFNSRSWQHGWFDGVKQVTSSRDKVSLNDD